MSWIIEGAKRAIDKNFHTTLPDVVEAAIQAYREDNDWLGQFLEECCEIDPSYKEKSGELYQAYRAHCMQNGEYIRSTTDFYSSMDKAGYTRIRKNTGVQVVGLKLKEGQDYLELEKALLCRSLTSVHKSPFRKNLNKYLLKRVLRNEVLDLHTC